MTANDMAKERCARQRKLIKFPELLNEVIERLKIDWSPEQIAGRLKTEPNAPHNTSHEAIYQFVYSKDGQERELGKLLPQRQKKRKPRYARKARGNIFPEADFMIFRRETGNANVATVIERISRYTVLFKNNDRQSKPIMNKLIELFAPLPFEARQSITFDRGFEFVSWRELDKGMGTKAWFCDPSAPWQKGSVENMDKRARCHELQS